eukprot:55117_1
MSIQDPFYKTVTRPQLAVVGYARENSKSHIPKSITDYCCNYFGYFYDEPESDPSNFISQLDHTKSQIIKEKGNILIKQKKYQEACKKYTEALSHNPNDVNIRCNRSLCFLKLKQHDKALNDSIRAVMNDPCSHKGWLRMAQSFEAMQKYSECLNIIQNAIDINEGIIKNDSQIKLLKKYKFSIEQKSKNETFRNSDVNLKSHVFDEDRDEWKGYVGQISEDKMTDQKLLQAPAFQIRHYSKSIIPFKIKKKYCTALGFWEIRAAKSEFHRWLNRKWIKKLHIHERINQCNSVTSLEYAINKGLIPKVYAETWVLSWSATETLYLNKRCFAVTIHRTNKPSTWIFTEDTYGVPTGEFMINCLKKAMFSPSDAIEQWMSRYEKYGGDQKKIPYGVLPAIIHVAWRAKNEFDTIFAEMMRFGVMCVLCSHEESVKACKEWNTNPDGWNYLDLDAEPKYRYDMDEDSSYIELMHMDIMRYQNN